MKPWNHVFVALLVFTQTAFADSPPNYEIFARLGDGPGNVTVMDNGRIFISLHQFYDPGYSVVELLPDGTTTPFPNRAINDRTSRTGLQLDSVLGIRADANGIVWMLDNGLRSGVTPKLIGWNTKTDNLHRSIQLPRRLPLKMHSSMTSRSTSSITMPLSAIPPGETIPH